MTKRVKLTEKQIRKAINEISYGAVTNASSRSDELFMKIRYAFENFYDELFELAGRYQDNEDGRTFTKVLEHDNSYIQQIIQHTEAIQEILERKAAQQENFDNETRKVDFKKFYDNVDRPEDEEDIYDVDLRKLQNEYPR